MLSLAQEFSLSHFQLDFAHAIFSGPIPDAIRTATGPGHISRFGVYRNNVIAGLINAVGARYPAVKRLLWGDTFERVACQYVMSAPPRSPVLLEYGESFPQFVRDFGQCQSADYVADVGELERLRTRAYHAEDVLPLLPATFSALSADDLPNLRLKLHSSVALLKSRFPVVSIWRATMHANDNAVTLWHPEFALIARPYFDVEVRPISAGTFEFLTAIASAATIGEAIARAGLSAPDFDLTECFGTLIDAGLVVDLESA